MQYHKGGAHKTGSIPAEHSAGIVLETYKCLYTPEQESKDALRTKDLKSMQLTVVRVCNLDIDRNFADVCAYIDGVVKNLSLSQLR